MGCGQSLMKKEINDLLALEKRKDDEIAKLQNEQRMLQHKITALEELVGYMYCASINRDPSIINPLLF